MADNEGNLKFSNAEKDSNSEDDDAEINKTEKTVVDDDIGGAPIDRGWAWVVLAGCVFEITVYGGLMRSFGYFFLQYQKRFGSSASETAIMNMIQNLVVSIAALFVMTIGLRNFSSRVSVFTGGVLTVVGYLITTFTNSLGMFYFAQGVLCGAGAAFIYPPMLAIIGVYFKKHRGLANSIFMAGESVGGLVFAPVVVKLFEDYQYSGAMLIVSALLMNIIPSALLMRPIEVYSLNMRQPLELLSDSADEESVIQIDEATQCRNGKLGHLTGHVEVKTLNGYSGKTISSFEDEDDELFGDTEEVLYDSTQLMRLQSDDHRCEIQNYQGSPMLVRARAHSLGVRQRTISQTSHLKSNQTLHNHKLKGVIDAISHSQLVLCTSGEGIFSSFIDVNTVPIQPGSNGSNGHDKHVPENEFQFEEENSRNKYCLSLKNCFQSILCTVFDLELLRNPVFLLFLLMAFSANSGLALTPVFIPTYANEIDISNDKIGLLISLLAIIDLVAKVSMGIISDRGWLQRPTIVAGACFLIGTASHLIRFINSFPLMVVYVVIAGISCGQYMSMFAVILIDITGPEKFKSSLGFGTLVHGISIAVFFPITGVLRDLTSTYVVPLHLLGSLAYCAGFLVLLIPVVNKRYKPKYNHKQKLLEDSGNKT